MWRLPDTSNTSHTNNNTIFGTRKAEVLNSLIINTTAKAIVSFALAVVFIITIQYLANTHAIRFNSLFTYLLQLQMI